MVEGRFQWASRVFLKKFKENSWEVSKAFKGYFKEVSRMFKESFASRKFQRCFEED